MNLNKTSKLFNPIPTNVKTLQGNAGFDNTRENIDPRILTKALLCKELRINNMKYPIVDGANGEVLKTNGAGILSWGTAGTTDHTALSNLNTTNYTHLTAANATDLTDAGDSTLHYHAADRNRANHTGVEVLPAGTTTAGTAPLKFTSGTNLTTAELGAIEFDGTDFYATINVTSAAKQTTDAHGVSLSSNATSGAFMGIKIHTKYSDLTLKKITKSSSYTRYTYADLRDSSFNSLARAAFVGNDASFNYTLSDNTDYYVTGDAGGSGVPFDYNASAGSYPYTETNVNITGACSGGTPDTLLRAIVSVTTERPGILTPTRKKFTLT